jgi:hypothetical protein
MERNFTKECLEISVQRERETNDLRLFISSDYSNSNHKGRQYVCEKRLSEEVERTWKSIKTKKLLRMGVSFGEIDHYDDMTDMYEVPTASIKRGLRKAQIGHTTHGSIPKDWSFNFGARFADTTTSTPIIEVVKKVLGSLFTAEAEKRFKKALMPILQKKTTYNSIYAYENND